MINCKRRLSDAKVRCKAQMAPRTPACVGDHSGAEREALVRGGCDHNKISRATARRLLSFDSREQRAASCEAATTWSLFVSSNAQPTDVRIDPFFSPFGYLNTERV
jgi:hypothetical protein